MDNAGVVGGWVVHAFGLPLGAGVSATATTDTTTALGPTPTDFPLKGIC